jgi:hypothetical protein
MSLSANQRDGAGRFATASPEVVLSPLAAFDACQKGGASNRRLSRLHPVGVRVQMNPQCNTETSSSISVLPFTSLKTGRGFGLGALSHSHRLPVPPLRLSRSGSVRSLAQTRTYSVNASGSRPAVLDTLSHQRLVNASADVLHVSNVLLADCTVRKVSCATKGLGNDRKAFGEIRNV